MVKAEAIQVCIRIRPPSALESAQDDAICCHKTGPDALSLTTVDGKANIADLLTKHVGSEDIRVQMHHTGQFYVQGRHDIMPRVPVNG